jgi:hypothetical protein
VLTRAQTLEDLALMWGRGEVSHAEMEAFEPHLYAARRAAEVAEVWWRSVLRPPADAERAFGHLAAAEAQIYRMAPYTSFRVTFPRSWALFASIFPLTARRASGWRRSPKAAWWTRGRIRNRWLSPSRRRRLPSSGTLPGYVASAAFCW